MADDLGTRTSEFIARLTEALGPKGVSTDPVEIDPHISDWRGRWKGSTPVLVKPATTEEVSKAMTLCAEYGFAVNPQGGNSGMVNGSVPQGEVLISLKRMNKVREFDTLNDAMTLEAGVVLTKAQEIADEARKEAVQGPWRERLRGKLLDTAYLLALAGREAPSGRGRDWDRDVRLCLRAAEDVAAGEADWERSRIARDIFDRLTRLVEPPPGSPESEEPPPSTGGLIVPP